MEDLHLVAKIYETYSNAKEKFIDRNFQTNRFFMVLCLVLLIVTYSAKLLAPNPMCAVILSAIGLMVSGLWWMNVDTYEFMIKVKYANVLEKIEDALPIKPYQDEFAKAQEIKEKKKLVVFPDLQKKFALGIVILFVWLFCSSIANNILRPVFERANQMQIQTIQEVVE